MIHEPFRDRPDPLGQFLRQRRVLAGRDRDVPGVHGRVHRGRRGGQWQRHRSERGRHLVRVGGQTGVRVRHQAQHRLQLADGSAASASAGAKGSESGRPPVIARP